MANDPKRVQEVFLAAVELPVAARAAFLDRECGGDAELRERVEGLLSAHEASGSFLNKRQVEPDQTVDSKLGAAQPGVTGGITATTDYRAKIEPGIVIAGRYALQEKIGEGGMGEVWVAKQTEPVKRRVALKLIKAGMDSKAVVSRFEQERQALAMMDHPNIARVLDGGMTPSGQPFFVMELVNGLALTKFCDEAKLTPRERLELYLPICHAVQHAHQKSIIHRDLKPANILVTLIDGRPVPKVIDFGVAKATAGKLTDESLSTQFGAVVGTLEYMSPEQAGFSGTDIDTRTDIYSLGAILYELLTGLRPIDAGRLKKAAIVEMIRMIQEDEPPKPSTRLSTDESLPSMAALRQTEPRKLMALLRGELDWVVMKCIEKQRDRRYDTANGLAHDIQRYLSDEPVEARPPSTAYRMSKFLKRHKGPAIAASLVLFALLAGILGTTWGLFEARRQEKEAKRQEQIARDETSEKEKARQAEAKRAEGERLAKLDAETKRAQAEQNLYFNRIALAERYWTASNVERAERYLNACPASMRTWEWGYLNRLCNPELRRFVGEGAAFTPNGRFLAIDDGPKKTVTLLDAATGDVVRTFPALSSHVGCFAISRDGKRLAAAGHDRTVKVWDITDGKEVVALGPLPGDLILDVEFSPDGKRLATAGARNNPAQGGLMAEQVRIWEIPSGKLIRAIPDAGHSIAFSPDGKRLAICTESSGGLTGVLLTLQGSRVGITAGSEKLVDTETGKEVWSVTMEGQSEKHLTFSPDGSMIASSYGRSGEIHVRDSATGKLLRTLRGHKDAATAVAFSPDGKRLAAGGVDSSVIIWDLDGDRKVMYRGHVGAIDTVGFSPDGRNLVTAGADRTVRLWDATRGQGPRVLPGSEAGAFGAAPSPDGSRIAVIRPQGVSTTITLVDAESGREIHQLRSLPFYNGYVKAILICFSPDGRWIASTDGKKDVTVQDTETGQVRCNLTKHPSQVTALGFDPDGKRLAVGFGEQIKIWSWAEGREVVSIAGRGYLSALAFSPDGAKLAVVGTGPPDAATGLFQPGFGQVWEAASGKLLFNLPRNNLPTVAVAFSPDGSRLATSSWDQTARLVDASNGKELFALLGHSSYVSAVGFSPDGSRLVTGSFDNTVKLWDVASGQEILELGGEIGIVGARFTTDGRRILAVGGDGKVRAWQGN